MNKADLVAAVAGKAGLKRGDAARAVDALLGAVREALARGERVAVPGFGAFVVIETKEKKARNPQTGKEITIPAGKAVRFRPGKQLRESVK
ncbi:HU family DNA-binding protein [Ammonifex thiophilus]|uniref:HU family DNA-binding protein n=1 Tax=Ammonifex thiophilus TaxID=444093 RepID=A0A3D8P3J0_9THEO|nr:HU family DNA-binding protein [Ammonifex thiophilus]RDV81806.1 HU family DNA-binding protein [Ammonifex thiophilus]